MRSFILMLCIIGLSFSLCPAQEPVSPATSKTISSVVYAGEISTVIGDVKSVSLADPAKGTKSEIVIEDKSNPQAVKEYKFLVTSATTIYDADWNATTLDKLNGKVKIKYATKGGVNEATSINVTK